MNLLIIAPVASLVEDIKQRPRQNDHNAVDDVEHISIDLFLSLHQVRRPPHQPHVPQFSQDVHPSHVELDDQVLRTDFDAEDVTEEKREAVNQLAPVRKLPPLHIREGRLTPVPEASYDIEEGHYWEHAQSHSQADLVLSFILIGVVVVRVTLVLGLCG